MSCVVDPFTISVKNTVPPVKKTNYTIKKQLSQFHKHSYQGFMGCDDLAKS